MAILYITSTNATGSGTLYSLIKSASPGDVITPDPEIFGVGERVEITFESAVKFIVPVTIDAGKTRLIWRRRNSGLIIDNRDYYGFSDFDAKGVAFLGRLLLSGDASTQLKCNFYNCIFGGFDYDYNSLHCTGNAILTLYDCALICGKGSAFAANIAGAEYTFYRCTFAANKKNAATDGREGAVYVDCIDEPDLATAQFANVPTSLDDVDVTKWEEYDFTPLPSSPYATGATTGAGASDIHGNVRGWKNGEETSYALGAYEVVKADYYFNPGSEASFSNLSSWSTDKGAVVSPEEITSGVFYIDENATFTDLPPTGSEIVVAGKTQFTLDIPDSGGAAIGSAVTLNENTQFSSNALVNEITIAPKVETSFLFAQNAILTALNSPDIYFYHGVHLSRLNADLGANITISADNDLILRIDEIQASAEININAVSTGRGYIAAPVGADTSKIVLQSSNVVLSAYGGEISDFKATVTKQDTVTLTGAQAGSAPVLLEYQNNAGAWTVLSADLHLSETGETVDVPQTGKTVYRVFDGENFFTDVAWTGISSGLQFKVISSVVGAEGAKESWQCIYQVIAVDESNIVRVGQSITVLARVFDAFDNNAPLVNDGSNISAITYSVEKSTKDVFTPVWQSVEGHTDVSVDVTALLEAPQTGDAWTVDAKGYNFVLVPDTREHVLFSNVGSYRIVVKITLSEGNPVVFYSYVNVVDAK